MKSCSRTWRCSTTESVSSTKGGQTRTSSYRCGQQNQDVKYCRFREAECHNFLELGHITSICKSTSLKTFQRSSLANIKALRSKRQYPNCGQRMNKVTAINDEQKLLGDMNGIQFFTIGGISKPFFAYHVVNGKKLTIEIDTGAAASLNTEQTFRLLYPELSLQLSHAILKTEMENAYQS